MWPYLVKDVYRDQVIKSMQAAQLVTGQHVNIWQPKYRLKQLHVRLLLLVITRLRHNR